MGPTPNWQGRGRRLKTNEFFSQENKLATRLLIFNFKMVYVIGLWDVYCNVTKKPMSVMENTRATSYITIQMTSEGGMASLGHYTRWYGLLKDPPYHKSTAVPPWV